MKGIIFGGFDLKFDHVLLLFHIVFIYILFRKMRWNLYKKLFFIAAVDVSVAALLYTFDNMTVPLIFYSYKFAEWSYYFIFLAALAMIYMVIFEKNKTKKSLKSKTA